MRFTGLLLVLALTLAGCVEPKPDYDPSIAPADFVQDIDNPWLPFPKGAEWIYEAGDERIEVRVYNETRDIMGVQATVVRDTVTIDGVMVEDTYDWFGQDKWGNVWYLGEDSKEYENGEFAGTEGSWEWGVDGALPGVIMWADPVANNTPYYQEFYWGEAVDKAAVIDTGRTVVVPAGTFTDTVTTKEWNPLEGGAGEYAHYARGIGPILKESVRAGGDRERLVSYTIP